MSASTEFRKATSQRALKQVYWDHVAKRVARGRDGLRPVDFERHLIREIKLASLRLRSGDYRFTAYRQLLVLKGADKLPRVLAIATVRDRIVLRALAGVLAVQFGLETIEPPAWKISRLRRRLESGEFDAFVRLDIERFFPSIPHDVLQSQLHRRIKKTDLVDLVMAACQTPALALGASKAAVSTQTVGVPQGLAISNVLAEIVMQAVDARFSGRPSVAYFRYVDDILVLCPAGERVAIDKELRAELGQLGLKAHDLAENSKSRLGLTSETFDFLGFVFSPRVVSARESTVRGLERKIAKVFTAYRYALRSYPKGGLTDEEWPDRCREVLNWRLDLLITGCILDGTRRGWVHYFSQIDDFGLLRRLDHQIERQLARHSLSSAMQPKSFRRAYWAITRPNSRRRGYVPDFDNAPISDLRNILTTIFFERRKAALSLDEPALRALFASRMQRILNEIEVDVGSLS